LEEMCGFYGRAVCPEKLFKAIEHISNKPERDSTVCLNCQN